MDVGVAIPPGGGEDRGGAELGATLEGGLCSCVRRPRLPCGRGCGRGAKPAPLGGGFAQACGGIGPR